MTDKRAEKEAEAIGNVNAVGYIRVDVTNAMISPTGSMYITVKCPACGDKVKGEDIVKSRVCTSCDQRLEMMVRATMTGGQTK